LREVLVLIGTREGKVVEESRISVTSRYPLYTKARFGFVFVVMHIIHMSSVCISLYISRILFTRSRINIYITTTLKYILNIYSSSTNYIYPLKKFSSKTQECFCQDISILRYCILILYLPLFSHFEPIIHPHCFVVVVVDDSKCIISFHSTNLRQV